MRGGDVAAYGTLFSRHVDAATRLARQLVRGSDADDLVSEAFVKVLNVLLGGGGPDVAFRAYLLTAVRRLHVDKVRSNQRLTTTDDLTPFDPGVPFNDTAVAGFEGGAAAKAFASLPERWQLVLWHLEVEGQKPADIAPLLGMSANSVSALAYRAREGLRQAFLTMHIGDLVSDLPLDQRAARRLRPQGAVPARRRQGRGAPRRLPPLHRDVPRAHRGQLLAGGAARPGPARCGGTGLPRWRRRPASAPAWSSSPAGQGLRARQRAATAATAAVVGIAGVTAIAVTTGGGSEDRPSAVGQPSPNALLAPFTGTSPASGGTTPRAPAPRRALRPATPQPRPPARRPRASGPRWRRLDERRPSLPP